MNDDLISRHAAIDDIETVNPSMLLDVDWVKNWVKTLPSVQQEIIHCWDCRYCKHITSIHGECESAEMWGSLFGEVTEVEAIEVHKDHYCGYAERRTDGETISE